MNDAQHLLCSFGYTSAPLRAFDGHETALILSPDVANVELGIRLLEARVGGLVIVHAAFGSWEDLSQGPRARAEAVVRAVHGWVAVYAPRQVARQVERINYIDVFLPRTPIPSEEEIEQYFYPESTQENETKIQVPFTPPMALGHRLRDLHPPLCILPAPRHRGGNRIRPGRRGA